MKKIVVAALAMFLSAAPTIAGATDVMWRTGDSGILKVNPLAAPAPVDPGAPTTPTGPGEQPMIMEVSSGNLFFNTGRAASNVWVMVSNGIVPIQLSLSGRLPAGLAFMPNSNSDGKAVIQGIPTATGSSTSVVTFNAIDAVGKTTSRTVNVHLNLQPLLVTIPPVVTARIGEPTLSSVSVVNARGAVSFTVLGGLPTGLVLNATTGAIVGVPSAGTAGTYTRHLVVTDAIGQVNRTPFQLVITE